MGMNGLYRGTAEGYQRGITGINYCVVRPHWDIVKGRFIDVVRLTMHQVSISINPLLTQKKIAAEISCS